MKLNSNHTSTLTNRPYQEQVLEWPASGRHIMAQFDSESIVVYQAYRPSIANFAVQHQEFGGEFSFSRMSWIKPNFLWMMFRSGWAAKDGQERILAVRLKRSFFDAILQVSLASSHGASQLSNHDEWKAALAESEVRLQWDPDHDPLGKSIERRAVQLGLRGNTLRRYGKEELISIEDITSFVMQQRENLDNDYTHLVTPSEAVYSAPEVAARNIGLDAI